MFLYYKYTTIFFFVKDILINYGYNVTANKIKLVVDIFSVWYSYITSLQIVMLLRS